MRELNLSVCSRSRQIPNVSEKVKFSLFFMSNYLYKSCARHEFRDNAMRKIFSIIVLLVASVTLFAQSDVTKFLGIPVDGSKADMIRKLKEKGFVSSDNEVLEGEFNGQEVLVRIGTNNNKVYRIAVVDKISSNETNIRIRFNILCNQFANNPKYIPKSGNVNDYIIPENEDISYEMNVKNKRYQANFYQIPDPMKSVWFIIWEYRGEYSIVMYYDNLYNQANGEDL